jgi:hypothetical protein
MLFAAYHDEADTGHWFNLYNCNSRFSTKHSISTYSDQLNELGNAKTTNLNGTLTLFNPSSTTYVKHFIVIVINYSHPWCRLQH